jgi:lysozyme family protein
VISGNLNSRIKNLVAGEPDWKKAIEYIHKGRRVLQIPANLAEKNLLAQGNGNMKKNSGDYRILLFQLQENQFKPYLFKIENGEDSFDPKNKNLKHLNLNHIPKDFSGKYMFFNLDGGFVGSWNIASGERTRAVSYRKPASSKSGKPNARISDYTYTCTITTFTIYVQAGSGDPEIVSQVEVYDCVFTPVPPQFAPAVPDTGGEDPGCYQPHTYFEGHMVPCDEPDPYNNFDDLVNKVLNTEGGFVNDPIDKGGATNKGIAWETWKRAAQPVLGRDPTLENLQNITSEDAKAIYKALFWDSIRLSDIEDGDLRWLIFDFHVNSGPNAMYQLQIILNELGAGLTVDGIIGSQTLNFINNYGDIIELYNKYKAKRISFLENSVCRSVSKYLSKFPNATEIELKSKTQKRFRDSWLNRVNEFVEKTIENYTNVNC